MSNNKKYLDNNNCQEYNKGNVRGKRRLCGLIEDGHCNKECLLKWDN